MIDDDDRMIIGDPDISAPFFIVFLVVILLVIFWR